MERTACGIECSHVVCVVVVAVDVVASHPGVEDASLEVRAANSKRTVRVRTRYNAPRCALLASEFVAPRVETVNRTVVGVCRTVVRVADMLLLLLLHLPKGYCWE